MIARRKLPALRNGQCAVLRVDTATGIVVNSDGEPAPYTENVYEVCESQESARQLAETLVAASDVIECVILNDLGEYLDTVRKRSSA